MSTRDREKRKKRAGKGERVGVSIVTLCVFIL